MEDWIKKEKHSFFKSKEKKSKKIDYPKAALQLAEGALILGAGLSLLKK